MFPIGGYWPESPSKSVILPLTGSAGNVIGVIIIGVNPRRAFDDDYKGFLELVSIHISQAINNAREYQAQKKRLETLAELDRAKTTFFSNVSHEFR